MFAPKRTIVVLAVVSALVAAAVAPAAASLPEERCYGVQTIGRAHTSFAGINADGQPFFVGTGDFRVGGLRFDDVAVTTTSLDLTTTQHVIEFPIGTITTRDVVILRPTDDPLVMSLRTRLILINGDSGHFHLLPSSTLTFVEIVEGEPPVPVAAAWSMRGHVCFSD
jgi:hypothetical protein